ncbi:CBN-MEX-1 protein [Caenorhabditis brenneri]|uniref:CBN-MEX-1 protein n=1 Tax=Caenorhabditis brenneri TaxID=135651 RepID=G0NZV0_CAEBE|nr:CBN-MEX-1 protein [Caenorhabditis brenneri]
MQSSNGEHHQQQQTPYFLGTPCDPNLLAFALSYPHHKNMYPQAFPSAQMTPLMLPQSALLPAMHQLANRSLIPSLTAAIPEMDKLSSLDEPIEAGSMAYRRSNNKSTSVSVADDSFNNLQRSTSSSHFRRHSAQWETMTDDEREIVQRQKRKEEAFKTALCDAFKRNGSCPYGESCRFAHGENELRMPSQPRGKAHPKYKTQLCDKFSTYGQCPYGPRCQFIHKLKKGLPLLEYNRALYQGRISPARDDEITNPDETPSDDQSVMNLTRNINRRRSSNGGFFDMSDSGYSGGTRRRLHHQFEQFEDQQPRGKTLSSKIVYPPMQVVNIEMATGQKKTSANGIQSESSVQNTTRRPGRGSQNEQLPSVIDQADYEASMASGKMFGKPENIRTYGAMIRANEDHVERNQTGTSKKDRVKAPTIRRDLSLIREEDTLLVDGSQIQSTSVAAPTCTSQTTNTLQAEEQPWYEKIFGKMTMIREESVGEEEDDSRLLAHDDIEYAK